MITDQNYLTWQQQLKTNKWFRRFWVFWGIYSSLFFIFIGMYLVLLRNFKVAVPTLISFVLARYIVSPLIYLFYKKPRPYQRLGFDTIYSWLMSSKKIIHNSFPSDHAIGYMSITAVLIYYIPVLGWLSAIIVLLNGLARIILGYHDNKDVLAGWLLGIACAAVSLYWLTPIVLK